MKERTVDVQATRAFGSGPYLMRKMPVALGMVLLGAVFLAMGLGGGSRDREGVALGIIFVVAGLGFMALLAYGRSRPGKPVLELSPAGILYRLASDKELIIPWQEVDRIGLVDIDAGRRVTFRNVTVVSVSQEFFEASVPVKSWWARGPGWRSHFIPAGYDMQIAFHHDMLSVDADELWQEIETRWRVFSGHPDAPMLATPRIPKQRGWIGNWTPSPELKRIALATLVVLAVPGIYFIKLPLAWIQFPNLTEGSASAYLEMALDRGLAHARRADGTMLMPHRRDVLQSGPTSCRREIARDDQRSGFLPAYAVMAYCTAHVAESAGAPAVAIFKLAVETSWSEDWQGVKQEYRAIAPVAIDAAEAETRLCALGACTPI